MAGHAQLKFFMTECSKTQIRLAGPTYHQTIYESDPSKGLEIMRCSNKVPKSVAHDVTRGKTDSSYSSLSYMGHTLATGTGQCHQTYKHLTLSLLAESSRSISIGMLIVT